MSDAALVVALANARADRRPTHVRRRVATDALADPAAANELLGPFLQHPLKAGDLEALRALQRAVASVVDALIDGAPPPLDALNELAAREPAVYDLKTKSDGALAAALRPTKPSAIGRLLIELVREFGELDPARLRRCARPECRLVFYDATRSGTQRWHAERPCGLRERQRRHRAKRSA